MEIATLITAKVQTVAGENAFILHSTCPDGHSGFDLVASRCWRQAFHTSSSPLSR